MYDMHSSWLRWLLVFVVSFSRLWWSSSQHAQLLAILAQICYVAVIRSFHGAPSILKIHARQSSIDCDSLIYLCEIRLPLPFK